MTISVAPPQTNSTPVIHKTFELYKLFHGISTQIPKRDRYGIYSVTEKILLETIELLLTASFSTKAEKIPSLLRARVQIESFKRFVRLMKDIKSIEEKHYLRITKAGEEISRMTNGWIKYLS